MRIRMLSHRSDATICARSAADGRAGGVQSHCGLRAHNRAASHARGGTMRRGYALSVCFLTLETHAGPDCIVRRGRKAAVRGGGHGWPRGQACEDRGAAGALFEVQLRGGVARVLGVALGCRGSVDWRRDRALSVVGRCHVRRRAVHRTQCVYAGACTCVRPSVRQARGGGNTIVTASAAVRSAAGATRACAAAAARGLVADARGGRTAAHAAHASAACASSRQAFAAERQTTWKQCWAGGMHGNAPPPPVMGPEGALPR